MKNFVFKPHGVCSREIHFTLDENGVITQLKFVGGCSGNTQGVSRLAIGRKAQEVIDILDGVRCGFKPTSCPDQLSIALREALEQMA